jgi:hypothetical protein
MIWRCICIGLLLLVWEAYAKSLPAPKASCEFITLEGDTGDCNKQQCILNGNAYASCGSLQIWADHLTIFLTPERAFAGAQAGDHVVMLNNTSLVTCTKMTLAQDQIEGHFSDATLRIKEHAELLDKNGRPIGRDNFVFHGQIDRQTATDYHIEHGDFTSCDCGEDRDPSWHLMSPEINATLNERATIWWPRINIHAFGLFDMPLTPPLLPISIPLKNRAPGFLFPKIAFFNYQPQLDLPFFIPLGESWDLTLSPGFRSDWNASPRLGSMLRYAPAENVYGELASQWAYDYGHFNAMRRQERAYMAPPYNHDDPTWDLKSRLLLHWEQNAKFNAHLQWVTNATWLSDDYVLQDFMLPLADRAASYSPSRTQLLWRDVGFVASIQADYFQMLNNVCTPEQIAAGDNCPSGVAPLNNWTTEGKTEQRTPFINLRMEPLHLGAHFLTDADISFVRYGAWDPSVPIAQAIIGGVAGITYANRLGPFNFKTRAGTDVLWVDPTQKAMVTSAVGVIDSQLDVSLARKFGDTLHVITPRLEYRGMPLRTSDTPSVVTVDPRLQRGKHFEQAMFTLEQSLWPKERSHPIIKLTVSQPWDLETAEVLQPTAMLEWNSLFLGGMSWTSVDWHRLGEGFGLVRELGGSAFTQVGPVRLTGSYALAAPDATRYLASIYQLAGPRLQVPSTGSWVHFVSGGVSINWPEPITLNYSTAYLLALPNNPNGRGECTVPGKNTAAPYPSQCFAMHQASVLYTSPCHCWSIGAGFVKTALETRIGITFGAGGYVFGVQ